MSARAPAQARPSMERRTAPRRDFHLDDPERPPVHHRTHRIPDIARRRLEGCANGDRAADRAGHERVPRRPLYAPGTGRWLESGTFVPVLLAGDRNHFAWD